MLGISFEKQNGRGALRVAASLVVLVVVVSLTWAFAGESIGRGLDSSLSASGQKGERARTQSYRYVRVQGLTIGNGFAGMFLERRGRTVRLEFLGPCGANYAGPVRVKNRRFRTTKTFKGGGWKVSGKFTKNNRKINGKLRSWYRPKGCDTGSRRYLMERV